MLEVGMKAMIVGARTVFGQQFIGRIVTIHQILHEGDTLDESVLRMKIRIVVPSEKAGGAIVQGDVTSHNGIMIDGYAIFKSQHLMPLPPLEDPGIDESTFTPIKNQQPIGA